MKKNSMLLIATFIFSVGNAYSQPIKFKKAIDGRQSGLGIVLSIVQDQKGFIWFGSVAKGLHKYDGKKLTAFSHNNDNSNSIASNAIFAVAVDSIGYIWVGSIGAGVDRLDPETKKFTHFRHDSKDPGSLGNDSVFTITTDRSGSVWIGTNRTLDQFNPATGKFKHFIIDELFNFAGAPEANPTINVIYEDSKADIWIGWGSLFDGGKFLNGGLSRLDKVTGKFTHYKHEPGNPNSLSDKTAFTIYEDSKHNFWVGTEGGRLQVLDRATGKFTHYDAYDPAQPGKISSPPWQGAMYELLTNITEDIKGRLWFSSFNSGITMYDPSLKRSTHFGAVSKDKSNRFANDTLTGFTDTLALRMLSSKDGLLWVTGTDGDIYTADFSTTTIPYVSLNTAATAFYYEDKSNILWILSDSGIIRKNTLSNQQKLYRRDLDLMDMKADGEGNIWMATHNNGLDKFDIKTEKYTHISHDKNNPASLVNDTTHFLFFDQQHFLWIGTHNGLSRMDTKTGHCTNYIHDPKDSLGLGKGHINAINEDKNGIVWIGNDEDVFSFNTKTGKFHRYELGYGSVANLCIDKAGNTWISCDDGLYIFDQQKERFKKFTSQVFPDGIDQVYGLVEDGKGNVWVSTNKNIIKINREHDEVKIFGAAQGVLTTTPAWLKNHITKDGRLFIGSSKGYYTFKPEELVDERKPPILNFTSFKIANKEIVAGQNNILAVPVWRAQSITLGYSQNTFSFEFGAIDYRSHDNIKYSYRLENYADEWRDLGAEPRVTFFNLPHGKYKLHIKAVNDDGSIAEKTMAITITAPWWQTWWAYALYALLIVIAGYLVYRYQKYYIVKRERERTQQKELAQAKEIEKAYTELKATQAQLIQSEKMASLGELTAGIAHEIQNPLNFVNNFSEVNKELIGELLDEVDKGNTEEVKLIAGDIKDNSEKINHHGRRADAIVKGMLQHSRSSTGHKEPTDINALCDEYLRLSYHGLRARDNSFNATMETDFDGNIGKMNIVPQDIGRVLLNLINNAFYAVRERQKKEGEDFRPSVVVSTQSISYLQGNTHGVEITVADNGNGIPSAIREKIFQPFFTTRPTGQGTGLGLSLSYDIIKAHGGTLEILSTSDAVGTTFVIKLPV